MKIFVLLEGFWYAGGAGKVGVEKYDAQRREFYRWRIEVHWNQTRVMTMGNETIKVTLEMASYLGVINIFRTI